MKAIDCHCCWGQVWNEGMHCCCWRGCTGHRMCVQVREDPCSQVSPSNLTKALETKLRSSGLPEASWLAKPSHQPKRNKAFEHGGWVERMVCLSTGDPNCTKQRETIQGGGSGCMPRYLQAREQDLRRNPLCDTWPWTSASRTLRGWMFHLSPNLCPGS